MPFGVLFSSRVCGNNRKLQNLVTGYEYNEKRVEKLKQKEREKRAAIAAARAARNGPGQYGRRQRRDFLDLTGGLATAVLRNTAEELCPDFSSSEEKQVDFSTDFYGAAPAPANDGSGDEDYYGGGASAAGPESPAEVRLDEPPFFIDKATLEPPPVALDDEEFHRLVAEQEALEEEKRQQCRHEALRLRVELLWEELAGNTCAVCSPLKTRLLPSTRCCSGWLLRSSLLLLPRPLR